MEDTIEDVDLTNNEEAPVGLPADPVEVEPIEEDIQENEVLKQRNQELYEQLKKAKGFVRDKEGKWVKKEVLQTPKETKISEDITRTELYSLVKANVPEEDTEEAITYAKSHGMTITEALKTPELKAILTVRKEYRQSSEVANTQNVRRGSAPQVSNEDLLERARQGEYSDADTLAKARIEQKLKNTKR